MNEGDGGYASPLMLAERGEDAANEARNQVNSGMDICCTPF